MTYKPPTHKIDSIDIGQLNGSESYTVRISYRRKASRRERVITLHGLRAVRRLINALSHAGGFVNHKRGILATPGKWWLTYNPYSKDRMLPLPRLLAALLRFRNKIAGGAELSYYDDTTPGDKNTECTWGLCSDDLADWPDPQDHTFPLEMVETKRSSPIYQGAFNCPFDQPWPEDDKKHAGSNYAGNGCFHRCLIFQRREKLNRDQALALYGAKIAQVVNRFGEVEK